ncbi:MAG: hypothetical protein CM1200mP18_07060 [Gammaproteobacteria bacterium]|nr:MAG: hypothetical protein CM1200mP18_07060 [Gammaproteobacteria bacterium]
MQEVSAERQIDIPKPVRDIYRQWRPSPLYRAYRLEAALDTRQDLLQIRRCEPSGSHKPNTAWPRLLLPEEGLSEFPRARVPASGDLPGLAGSFFGLEIEVSWSVSSTRNLFGARLWRLSAPPAPQPQ